MADEQAAPEKPTKEEVQTREKKGWPWPRVFLYVIAILILIAVAGYMTIGVTIGESTGGASYPYTTTYQVLFPSSEVVRIGNTELVAIPVDGRVTFSVNKEVKEIATGETKEIEKRKATITFLGIPILAFDFRVDATYLGKVGGSAQFYLAFKTSQQVPSFLIDRLLPPNVQARPV